ncbi:MAG: chorismate lyase [Pseudohongiellaceae bacterium]
MTWTPLGGRAARPAPAWLDWLAEPGSLTARLKRLSGDEFRVDVLSETWIRCADPALLRQFGPLAPGARFWSRQVCLEGRGEPWVLAHTLIPEYALQSPLAELRHLAQRPLGEYLFGQAQVRRGSLEITPVAGDGWARRSVFYLHGQPLMVAESFLPALLRVAAVTGRQAGPG